MHIGTVGDLILFRQWEVENCVCGITISQIPRQLFTTGQTRALSAVMIFL